MAPFSALLLVIPRIVYSKKLTSSISEENSRASDTENRRTVAQIQTQRAAKHPFKWTDITKEDFAERRRLAKSNIPSTVRPYVWRDASPTVFTFEFGHTTEGKDYLEREKTSSFGLRVGSIMDIPICTEHGETRTFHLSENRVMPQSLQDKFPDIRSFHISEVGPCRNDQCMNGDLSTGPDGIRAQIWLSDGSVTACYLDPHTVGRVDKYTIYKDTDKKHGKSGMQGMHGRRLPGSTAETGLTPRRVDHDAHSQNMHKTIQDMLKEERNMLKEGRGLSGIEEGTSSEVEDNPFNTHEYGRQLASAEKKIVTPPPGKVSIRSYRICLMTAPDYIEYAEYYLKSKAMAVLTATATRAFGIWRRVLHIDLQLCEKQDLLVDAGNVGHIANGDAMAFLDNCQFNFEKAGVKDADYDLGHYVSASGGGGVGACCVCLDISDAHKCQGASAMPEPSGDIFDVGLLAHEVGHQFNLGHTFGGRGGYCTPDQMIRGENVEVGSGHTILSYAGICDDVDTDWVTKPYFNSVSLGMYYKMLTRSDYPNWGSRYEGAAQRCGTVREVTNQRPTATSIKQCTVPKRTPFVLSGTGSDPDPNTVLSYTWEQIDYAPKLIPLTQESTRGALFYSTDPLPSGHTRHFPQERTTIMHAHQFANEGVITNSSLSVDSLMRADPFERLSTVTRDLHFTLTVRDTYNKAGGSSVDDSVGSWHSSITEVSVAKVGPLRVTQPTLRFKEGTTTEIDDSAKVKGLHVQWTMVGYSDASISNQPETHYWKSKTDKRYRIEVAMCKSSLTGTSGRSGTCTDAYGWFHWIYAPLDKFDPGWHDLSKAKFCNQANCEKHNSMWGDVPATVACCRCGGGFRCEPDTWQSVTTSGTQNIDDYEINDQGVGSARIDLPTGFAGSSGVIRVIASAPGATNDNSVVNTDNVYCKAYAVSPVLKFEEGIAPVVTTLEPPATTTVAGGVSTTTSTTTAVGSVAASDCPKYASYTWPSKIGSVVATIPKDNALNIPTANLFAVFLFDQPISLNETNTKVVEILHCDSGYTGLTSIVPSDERIIASGNTLTIGLTDSARGYSGTLKIIVPAGLLVDVHEAFILTFTTNDGAAQVLPTVAATSPANGVEGVPYYGDSEFAITLSEWTIPYLGSMYMIGEFDTQYVITRKKKRHLKTEEIVENLILNNVYDASDDLHREMLRRNALAVVQLRIRGEEDENRKWEFSSQLGGHKTMRYRHGRSINPREAKMATIARNQESAGNHIDRDMKGGHAHITDPPDGTDENVLQIAHRGSIHSHKDFVRDSHHLSDRRLTHVLQGVLDANPTWRPECGGIVSQLGTFRPHVNPSKNESLLTFKTQSDLGCWFFGDTWYRWWFDDGSLYSPVSHLWNGASYSRFKTMADTTSPKVLEFLPANASTKVEQDAIIEIYFNEDVYPSEADIVVPNITIIPKNEDKPIFSISPLDKAQVFYTLPEIGLGLVTIIPNYLWQPRTIYSVKIPQVAFEDWEYNTLGEDITWTFTTDDTTPPVCSFFNYTQGDIKNADLEVTASFVDSIDQLEISQLIIPSHGHGTLARAGTFWLKPYGIAENDVVIRPTVTVSVGDENRFSILGKLTVKILFPGDQIIPGTTYTLEWSDTALQDDYGNLIQGTKVLGGPQGEYLHLPACKSLIESKPTPPPESIVEVEARVELAYDTSTMAYKTVGELKNAMNQLNVREGLASAYKETLIKSQNFRSKDFSCECKEVKIAARRLESLETAGATAKLDSKSLESDRQLESSTNSEAADVHARRVQSTRLEGVYDQRQLTSTKLEAVYVVSYLQTNTNLGSSMKSAMQSIDETQLQTEMQTSVFKTGTLISQGFQSTSAVKVEVTNTATSIPGGTSGSLTGSGSSTADTADGSSSASTPGTSYARGSLRTFLSILWSVFAFLIRL